jgi:hypothetical protein
LLKPLKKSLQEAKEKHWIEEAKIGVAATTKTGKTTMKKTPVLHLTEEGMRFLQEASSPEVLAATTSAHFSALTQGLEADRRKLRDDVVAFLAGQGTRGEKGSLAKELAEVSKAVTGLAGRIQKLEALLQGGVDDRVLLKIDEGFKALTTVLAKERPGPAPARQDKKPSPEPPAPEPVPLQTALRSAYEKLCCFREFQDGLVEIPRLYHELRKSMADLSVPAFHAELQALWDARSVQLHVLNEVRSATEPEKGLRRNDKLYYYVYWPKP